MSPQDWITIGSLVVGVLGLAFGIYIHFSTRRSANLNYEVTQLTDYGFPEQFMSSLINIPIVVVAKNVGNKSAERVNIVIDTAGLISHLYVEGTESHEAKQTGFTQAQVKVPSLNPGAVIKIFIQCEKNEKKANYVGNISVSHSDGIGTERKSLLGKPHLG